MINADKEFCDCEFRWKFRDNDAFGKSTGKTLTAYMEEEKRRYKAKPLSAENAAAIACKQVLGSYIVRFER